MRNGRIAAIGTKEDVLIWQTPDTVVQDFGGAFIMPVSSSSISDVAHICNSMRQAEAAIFGAGLD